ncbi:MAG: tRNA (adenosine(37)-N6)-threonylcarbamoyltransferase complex ATPase subunit type 1 TsaE [Gemmatimonadaceae bacterium]
MPVAELTEPELRAWGETLGASIASGSILTLEGDLGAGKTTLAQAIARGWGVTAEVTSPTYAIVQAYAGPRGPLHHLDLYRLDHPAQLAQIGWDEILRAGGLVLIEWPDRAGDALPRDLRRIQLAHLPSDPSRRQVTW